MQTPSGMQITGDPGTWAGNGLPNIPIPGDGQVFRATGDQGDALFMRQGNAIQRLNLLDPNFIGTGQSNAGVQMGDALQTLKARGLDYNSLPQYNMGDLNQQANNLGLTFGSVSTAPPNAYFPGGSPTTSDAVSNFIAAHQKYTSALSNNAAAQNTSQNNQIDAAKINANAQAKGQSQSFAPQQPNPTAPTVQPLMQALASNGLPSDFTYRSQLAAQAGIQNYAGTPQQNNQIMLGLRSGHITPAQFNNAPQSVEGPALDMSYAFGTSTPPAKDPQSATFSIGAPIGAQPQSQGMTEDLINKKANSFFTWLETGGKTPFDF